MPGGRLVAPPGQKEAKAGAWRQKCMGAEAVVGEGEGMRRRDFINVAAVSFAGIGRSRHARAADQPDEVPSADVLAQATTELDLSAIEAGQGVKAVFRSQPLFRPAPDAQGNRRGRRRIALLAARSPGRWSSARSTARSNGSSPWASAPILVACRSALARARIAANSAAIFCPCHGSQYDTAARIRKGPGAKEPRCSALQIYVRHACCRWLRTR